MRFALFAAGSLASIFAIPAPSLSGISVKTVAPGTQLELFEVSVTKVVDDGARTRSPASPSPGWGSQAYQFSVTGDFSNVEPNQVGGSVRIVAGGRLLATATLEPRWRDGQVTFEVTISDSIASGSELNVYYVWNGPAADFWIFPIGEYLKSAD